MRSVSNKLRTGVLELHTDHGSVFVAPTFSERLYLLWIFRHFHSLSRQILSRRQQMFMEALATRAVSDQSSAKHRANVIGRLENFGNLPMHKPATAQAANNVVEIPISKFSAPVVHAVGSETVSFPRRHTFRPKSDTKMVVSPTIALNNTSEQSPSRGTATAPTSVASARTKSWLHWATAAVSLASVLAVLLVAEARLSSNTAGSKPEAAPLLPPVPATAVKPSQHLPSARPASIAESKLSPGAALAGRSAETDSVTPAKLEVAKLEAKPVPRVEVPSAPAFQISGAPEHGLTYPEAPNANLAGIVKLKALIAPDGSVKDVIVLHGNRALGAAAVQAVRYWRYAPPELKGQAVEAETRITFTFLGDDAVSVSFPSNQN